MELVKSTWLIGLAALMLVAGGCGAAGGGSGSGDDDGGPTPDVTAGDTGGTDTPIGDDATDPDTADEDTAEPEVWQDPCTGKECGTGTDGSNCGNCPAGKECSVDFKCEAPKNAMGEFCGISAECTPDISNPANPSEMIDNPAYPECMHDQCSSKFCLNAGAPGAYVFTYPVCSRPCEIYVDVINNHTGAQGADGVEDPDAPISDCDTAVDGPAGDTYTCVNFAPPGGSSLAYCLPGTTFSQCGADTDCPGDEVCMLTGVGGSPNSRCFAAKKSGEWGEVVGLGEDCNANPFDGDVTWCESGLCFGLGCVTYCNEDTDCDTTVDDAEAGCDLSTGTCFDWDSQTCSTDLDCSAWTCGEPRQIFSNVPEYSPTLCWPYTCVLDGDCPPGNYCRFYWNGEPHPDAGWDNLCLAQAEGGVGLGEACDPDPSDNIPGETCENADLCLGGFCSALCDTDDDCATDKEQICTAIEFSGDYDEDGETDFILPLEWCTTHPGMTTPCMSETSCGEGETCDIYEVENDGDPDAPYTMKGVCAEASTDEGIWGNLCGVPGADFLSCQSGFCMGANSDEGQAGYCTHVCESHTDCPEITIGGETSKGRCQALLLGWGGDLYNPAVNNYVSLCLLTPGQSSLADCSETYDCDTPGEACLPYMINFGPTYEAKVEYLCVDMSNSDGTLPTKGVGEACNPQAEDLDGNPVNECKSGFCLDAPEVGQGYCSDLCDPAADTCAADSGAPDMACMELVIQPRQGAYEDNAGAIWLCERDQDCTPCIHSGQCPGDRSCANLSMAGLLEDYRCVPSCDTDADCGDTACSEGEDGNGQLITGCFDVGPNGPINFCAE